MIRTIKRKRKKKEKEKERTEIEWGSHNGSLLHRTRCPPCSPVCAALECIVRERIKRKKERKKTLSSCPTSKRKRKRKRDWEDVPVGCSLCHHCTEPIIPHWFAQCGRPVPCHVQALVWHLRTAFESLGKVRKKKKRKN